MWYHTRMDDELRRKLQRLGVVRGLHALQPPPPPRPVVSVPFSSEPLPGEVITTAHGSTWIVQHHYPANHRHGRYTLEKADTLAPETLALLGIPDLGDCPAFLDTETTGLAGGTGTLIFLTGVGLWQPDGFDLYQVFLRDPSEERAALDYLADLLAQASSLVTFNGRGFDLPLLEGRFILQRMVPRWRGLPHLDLLLTARTLWREHLPSRRLGFLEEALLGINRSQEDLPGWLIPAAYREYLQTGTTTEMSRIFYHNEIDIISLVSLLRHVARLTQEPEALGVTAAEWVGLGRLYDQAGCRDEANAAWHRALEEDALPPDTAERLWRELSMQRKQDQDWENARALWESWANRIPWAIEPLVERAKYAEWVAQDLDAALQETQRALQRLPKLPNGFSRQQWAAALQHRQQRLERKLNKK